jgi:DNA-binding NtrC family response regulator
MRHQILIVDDQISFCHHLKAILEQEGYDVILADGAKLALQKLTDHAFDVLLTDMKMPNTDGLQLFKMARKIDPDISGVIMTAYGSVSSAVLSIKQGFSDYIQKPFEPETLLMVVEKTFRERRMLEEIRSLRKEIGQRYAFGSIIGKDHKMQAIYDLIQKVAPTDARVFITGETGVGKELVAKAIHFNSRRKGKSFVGINCGALAENLLESELFGHEKGAFTGAVQTKKGKFEYAQGGTLFLDEVAEISPSLQVKLLRITQEKKFERVGGNRLIDTDVRIIAATNKDIKTSINRGDFRLDLYYRLNVVPIHIPPLRERIEDIPLLVNHFVTVYNKKFNKQVRQIAPPAMNSLMQHHWPGNVRELENVIERSFVTIEGEIIDKIVFSHDINSRSRHKSSLYDVDTDIPFKVAKALVEKRFEKAYILEALKRYDGNVSKAAEMTGISPRTLWRKLKEHEIDRTGNEKQGQL